MQDNEKIAIYEALDQSKEEGVVTLSIMTRLGVSEFRAHMLLGEFGLIPPYVDCFILR